MNLSQVARCCNSLRSLPNQVSWYLENKPDTHPKDTVQCLVDMNCCLADEQSPPINTSLYIDELQLRAKDRENVRITITRLCNIQQYFTAVKQVNLQMKNFNIFLFFAQNIDCVYTLEPPP